MVMRSYMLRSPNMAISLCIVSSAKQSVSYFCMYCYSGGQQRCTSRKKQPPKQGAIHASRPYTTGP